MRGHIAGSGARSGAGDGARRAGRSRVRIHGAGRVEAVSDVCAHASGSAHAATDAGAGSAGAGENAAVGPARGRKGPGRHRHGHAAAGVRGGGRRHGGVGVYDKAGVGSATLEGFAEQLSVDAVVVIVRAHNDVVVGVVVKDVVASDVVKIGAGVNDGTGVVADGVGQISAGVDIGAGGIDPVATIGILGRLIVGVGLGPSPIAGGVGLGIEARLDIGREAGEPLGVDLIRGQADSPNTLKVDENGLALDDQVRHDSREVGEFVRDQRGGLVMARILLAGAGDGALLPGRALRSLGGLRHVIHLDVHLLQLVVDVVIFPFHHALEHVGTLLDLEDGPRLGHPRAAAHGVARGATWGGGATLLDTGASAGEGGRLLGAAGGGGLGGGIVAALVLGLGRGGLATNPVIQAKLALDLAVADLRKRCQY